MAVDEAKTRKILAQISEKEAVDVLRRLVQFKTVNPPGNEKDCAEYIAEYLSDAGAHVELLEREKNRPNVVAKMQGTDHSTSLMLNGHIDVVAPSEGWSLDPFAGVEKNGRIYGRGASDMKSGVAASMVATKALLESGVSLKGDLTFTAVADEESLGPAGTRFLLEKGLRADMGIVTEPTDLRIEVAQRGILWLEVRVDGKAAHGGRPWLGISAIYRMMDFLNALRELERQLASKKHELVTSPSINVGTIEGGFRVNVVPDTCTIRIDRRLIPGETIEEAQNEILQIFHHMKLKDPSMKETHRILVAAAPFEIPHEHPTIVALERAARTVLGQTLPIAGKDAGTDAIWMVEAGIPTVMFGPGQYKASHTADEYAEVGKLLSGTKVLALAAYDLLNGEKHE
ncbi:MAG: M20 family metallopeptidase [Candidatus Bathyarchaeia archaeon]